MNTFNGSPLTPPQDRICAPHWGFSNGSTSHAHLCCFICRDILPAPKVPHLVCKSLHLPVLPPDIHSPLA